MDVHDPHCPIHFCQVLAEMHQQVATTKAAGKAVIVVDVPLLFESCRDAKQTPKERYSYGCREPFRDIY